MKYVLLAVKNRTIEVNGQLPHFYSPVKKFYTAFGRSLRKRNVRKRMWNVETGITTGLRGELLAYVRQARRELYPTTGSTQSTLTSNLGGYTRTSGLGSNGRPPYEARSKRQLRLIIVCHEAFADEIIAVAKSLRSLGIKPHFLGTFSTTDGRSLLSQRAIDGVRYTYHATPSSCFYLGNGPVVAGGTSRPSSSRALPDHGLNGVPARLRQLEAFSSSSNPMSGVGLIGMSSLSKISAAWQLRASGHPRTGLTYDALELERQYDDMLVVARSRGVPVEGLGKIMHFPVKRKREPAYAPDVASAHYVEPLPPAADDVEEEIYYDLVPYSLSDVPIEELEVKNLSNVVVAEQTAIWYDLYFHSWLTNNQPLERSASGEFIIMQGIEEASGWKTNYDFYSIKIERLPGGLSMKQFFDFFRLNLNDFTNATTNFYQYSPQDSAVWQSDNPKGAVMQFDAGVININLFQEDVSDIVSDDLTVVVTAYHESPDFIYWVFSTAKSKKNAGHAVSGSRQFGISRNCDDEYLLWTRGIDRAHNPFDVIVSPAIFDGGHKLWSHLFGALVKYIATEGGKASLNKFISERH